MCVCVSELAPPGVIPLGDTLSITLQFEEEELGLLWEEHFGIIEELL